MERPDIDLAELRGHVHIHCRRCGYRGWSEDTGGCPRCAPLDRIEPELCEEDHAMDEARTMTPLGQWICWIWDHALRACTHTGGEDDPCTDCLQAAVSLALAAAVKAKGEAMLVRVAHLESHVPLVRAVADGQIALLRQHAGDVPPVPK